MTCGTCRWWEGRNGFGTGDCRRHAPILKIMGPPYAGDMTVWPRTDESAGCGDHEVAR